MALVQGPGWLGEFMFGEGDTIHFKWNTFAASGASITRSTNGSILIYNNDSDTERASSSGITDTEDFDGKTGVHHLSIDLADNDDPGFYDGGEYTVVLSGAVIDGQTVNAVLATFSIDRSGGVVQVVSDLNNSVTTLFTFIQGLILIPDQIIGDTGNDTTHVHLSSLSTYGNDEVNNMLLVIKDVSESEYHSRWIEDFDAAADLVTVATLPFTPENNTDKWWLLSIRRDVSASVGAADIRSAIGLASANLDTQLSDIDNYIDTEVSAIKAKTDQLTFGVSNTVNVNVTYVNEVEVGGAGTSGTPWGPA